MLFFSKSKPLLKDLIPNTFTDIHSHLMNGIDDGAKTPDDTLFLVSELKKIGFKNFITTPHTFSGFYDTTKEIILNKEQETKELLLENKITNSLKASSEYLMDDHFVSLFQQNEILPLKENYVLVEMSYLNAPLNLFDILFDLQVAGYKPVLAHPERYLFYHKKLSDYTKLKNAGCLFQLNLLSSVGYYGTEVAESAKKLLDSEMYDFVGSDVHHKNHVNAFYNKIVFKNQKGLETLISKNQFFDF